MSIIRLSANFCINNSSVEPELKSHTILIIPAGWNKEPARHS